MIEPSSMKVTSVSVLYHPGQDRLVLITGLAGGDKLSVLVTRRLASKMVNVFAQLLERTSVAAQEAPSRARDDVIMFEHQNALAAKRAAKLPVSDNLNRMYGNSQDKEKLSHFVLLEAVDVRVATRHFILILKATGGRPIGCIDATRADLHFFLNLLHRRSKEAKWSLPTEGSWLNLDAGSMVLN